ncbi:MAG: helix-hairpin-helix domain-containing protein [Rickettsia endosymbiont of Ixodes persulcatus]|nr:helix-hairpin-helix domain-containing protein [Rickettsia endosymbiont of Ixodes persulcatus]
MLVCSFDVVVEDVVNVVGVDLNTVSVFLLVCVFGVIDLLVEVIVVYCEMMGLFCNRKVLLKVPRLGFKVFE